MPSKDDNPKLDPTNDAAKHQDEETGTPHGAGFTGGTQEKTRPGTKDAQDHADSGRGL